MGDPLKYFFITTNGGEQECVAQINGSTKKGIALLAHPHPLWGGTMDFEVMEQMSKSFASIGYVAIRMNFRGVGRSQGTYASGIGEAEDMCELYDFAKKQYGDLPVVLGGYSFGTYVQALACQKLKEQQKRVDGVLLVSSAVGLFTMPAVPKDALILHGTEDTMIKLDDARDWAKTNQLTITEIAGADHFWGSYLSVIDDAIKNRFGERKAS